MRKLLKTVVAFFLLAGLAVVIFILGHGCVDLSVLKGAAARTIAGQILRPTEIGGTFELHFTPAPVLECSDLRIYDPGSGRKNPLLQLGRIRLGVRVVPLLVGRVEVVELRVADLGLHLRRFADGRKNWLAMDGREDAALQENGNRNTSPDRLAPSGGGSLSIDSITLENIDVWYLEDRPGAAGNNEEIKAGGEHRLLHVAAIHGQLPPDKPLALRGDGVLLGSSFSFRTHLASAAEFARENVTWLTATVEIAENVLEAEGRLDLNPGAEQLELNLSLAGQELAKLTPLTGLDLPPITDYSVTGSLKAQEGVFQLDRFHFRTASSELDGKLRVGRNGELVLLEAQLDAPAIQLDDFLFDNWSWLADAQAEATARETHPSAGDRGEGERLLSPQLLRTVEGRIAVRAGRVLSGKDHMGAGRLLLEMGDNTLRLSPLVLEFPGGVIRAEVDLALGERTMSGTIRSRIEDFDIGVWARRQQPDTGIGGLVNLDMELSGEGESIAEILDHGDGYLDFSGRLTGFESGGVDLWAVNLVRAALFSLKRDTSYINCAVGRFRAEAGRLIPDTLFVDTTGIRICGMGEVELPGRKMNMLFYPVAKKSQFYSLALPVKVEGSFGDLGFRFPKTELLGTAVTFLTSPIHVPLRWLTEKPIPADGSDVCGMELGPVARQTKVPGCFRSDLP